MPIIPAGLEYRRGDRWRLTVRFGAPVALDPERDYGEQVAAIEERVRGLSHHGKPCHEAGAQDRSDPIGTPLSPP